jgi:hypothetical protein
MNNTLHTPSPWHLQKSESDFIIVHYDGENRSHVAKLFDSTLCEEHGSLSANARLIAAAPDLLDALDWALRQIEDDLDPDHQVAFDVAFSTLRKAKGEA